MLRPNARPSVPGRSHPIALGCAAALLSAATALAQPAARRPIAPGATPTAIRFNFSGGCAFDEDTPAIESMAALARDYNDGTRWPQLQRELTAMLATCVDDHTPESPRDLSAALAKQVLVTFIADGRPYYVVLPEAQPYSLTMTGARSVAAVVLVDAASRLDAPTDVQLMSSRIEDPRQSETPAFVRDIAGTIVRGYHSAAPRHHPRVWAFAADEVELPFRRASIAESGTVTLNCDATGSSSLAPCPRGKDRISVDIATTWTNTPKTRIEFTAVAGGVVGPYRGHMKMKVDAGRYASDPAKHATTMAAVAIHFRSYDSSLPDISRAERWSVLIGGVLTPAAGIGAGLSIGVIRGFALNVGELMIWVPSGSSTGAPAPDGSNQLPHRLSYGSFVGASYAFAR